MLDNSLMPARLRANGDDNLIPLINIVFLLLIFFMIAGQVRPALPDLSLPQHRGDGEYTQQDWQLVVDRDNQLYLNGDMISLSQLQAALAEPVPAITLLADSELRAGQLDQTLDILRAARVARFSLLTESREASQ